MSSVDLTDLQEFLGIGDAVFTLASSDFFVFSVGHRCSVLPPVWSQAMAISLRKERDAVHSVLSQVDCIGRYVLCVPSPDRNHRGLLVLK